MIKVKPSFLARLKSPGSRKRHLYVSVTERRTQMEIDFTHVVKEKRTGRQCGLEIIPRRTNDKK